MVRLFDGKNVNKISNLIFKVLKVQELFTRIIEINNPDKMPVYTELGIAQNYTF